MRRPVITVDVDDVCFDFPSAYAKWLVRVGRLSFDPAGPHHYRFAELLGISQAQYFDDCTAALAASVDAAPLLGCRDGLVAVAAHAEVWLVSARLQAQASATEAWASRWNLPVAGVRCVGDADDAAVAKAQACTELGAIAHIDDNPAYLRALLGSPTLPVAFGMYHWSAAGPWPLARSWAEVPAIVATVGLHDKEN